MDTASSVDDAPSEARVFWQRLAYRWFVEYNPLYLLSATLVLGGCILWSRGLVQADGLAAPLGIALVAELYACSLVGGAALLMRIGLRRPAVLLALIFVLYQWDLTLHTETCAYLGVAGGWAAAAWLVLFGGKLFAIGWALQVRFERRFVAAALLAALGLTLLPRVLPGLGGRGAGGLVAVWLFALGALYRRGGIESRVRLDAWGQVVLRRGTDAAWALSGALVTLHVLMWQQDHDISLAAPALAVPLLFVRHIEREARAWGLVLATLFLAIQIEPAFSVVSFLAAAALCLRALSPAFDARAVQAPASTAASPPTEPYRAGSPVEASLAAPPPSLATIGRAERARAFVGALFLAYLALWTLPWTHGAWPAHQLALDAALGLAVALGCWRLRTRFPLLPLFLTYGHLVVRARLIPVPTTSVAWGETVIVLGFVLLGGSLLASYRLRGLPASSP